MKERVHMSVAQRAKQFAPFAAISSLEAALKEQEDLLLMRDKPVFFEEYLAELDTALSSLSEGDDILLTLFRSAKTTIQNAIFISADAARRVLYVKINGRRKEISFDELVKIEKRNIDEA